jgi:plasmid stabilization system protein ParE
MAKRLIWSPEARRAMSEIFEYWNNRNRSTAYSEKLFRLFVECGNSLINFPQQGKPTVFKGIRGVIVKDYLLLYTDKPDEIRVVTIFDTRQNPAKLTDRLK